MTDTLPPISRLHALRHTPLLDLLRGRLSGRLDWRGVIDRATDLPEPIRDLIRRVIGRTRLWRLERADVARELIAHFADGLAAGEHADSLIRDFGDERQAAKLIRRAKRRNRPYLWHARKWALRALMVLIALYIVGVVRFFMGHAQVKVDYVARLNEPVLRIPPQDRAWPLYRGAILGLQLTKMKEDPDAIINAVISDQPSENARWQEIVTWLDANQASLDLIRQGAAKPALGFVFGPDGDATDPQLDWQFRHPADPNSMEGSLISLLLPYLTYSRQLGYVLLADFDLALQRGDSARAERDFDAVLGLAHHQESPMVICGLVAIGIDVAAFNRLDRALFEHPERFDDAMLVRLAHRISRVADGGHTASSMIDLSGERMAFDDVLQRLYTDDGNGDGRLAREGLVGMTMISGITGDKRLSDSAWVAGMASGVSLADARRDNALEYGRLMDVMASALTEPYRETADATQRELERSINRLRSSPLLTAHYMPVVLMTPVLTRAGATAERMLAKRDGLMVGIALEVYRRKHGAWPTSLDQLVPALLPEVPTDPASGHPFRMTIRSDRPIVYGDGVDGQDDGGRPRADVWKGGMAHGPDPDAAGVGNPPPKTPLPPNTGDWILFGPRFDRLDENEDRWPTTQQVSQPTSMPSGQ